MSLETFKRNLKLFLDNPSAVDSTEDFAEKLTIEYDLLIKSGGDSINNVAVSSGNTDLMQRLLNLELRKYKANNNDNFMEDVGASFIGYWSGATLNSFPIPITPAIGSVSNIAIVGTAITNTGEWRGSGRAIPTNNSENFIDQLSSYIEIHLFSVEGIFNTTSLYPPGTPGPGVVQWSGYSVN